LYFLPLPHGHGSLRPTFGMLRVPGPLDELGQTTLFRLLPF
jgi:hypothetical protein